MPFIVINQGLGSVKLNCLEARRREPAPGKPLLVIYGSLGMGSLKVRPPSRFDHRGIS